MTIDRDTADAAFEVLSAQVLELHDIARQIVAELTFDQAAEALLYIARGYAGTLSGIARAAGRTPEDVIEELATLRQQDR